MNRRDFVQSSLALAGASLLSNELWAAAPPEKSHIGVQLWSVRDFMAKDPKGTLERLAKMGYREVEGFGFQDGKFLGLATAEYASVLKNNGLRMPSCHMMVNSTDYNDSTKELSDGFKKAVDAAKQVGQKFVISPYMLDPDRTQGKRMADIFNIAGEYCKGMGMKFGYHNHNFEFETKDANGVSLYTTLLDNTDPKLVTFEMDLYWVVFANEKPAEWFNKYKNRFTHFHVKDLDAAKRQTVEVGEGSINFQEIFNSRKTAGAKYFIVELEHYKRPSIEGVEVALKNLKKLKFGQ
jgi:sugar phosphate isomerase/epimerase